MKESVRAEQFLCVKQALQYVNGHAEFHMVKGIINAFDLTEYCLDIKVVIITNLEQKQKSA